MKILAVLIVLSCVKHGFSLHFREDSLDVYCGRTLTIPCNTLYYRPRAGTLKFSSFMGKTCHVQVVFETPYGCMDSAYEIYVNVRESVTPRSTNIKIYEVPYGGEKHLLKKITGGNLRSYGHPESVAQLLTSLGRWRKASTLAIELDSDTSYSFNYDVKLDWTLVRTSESAGEIRCNALDAYVPKNLVCRDKDDEPDRIVCPDDFYRSVSDLSPASGAQKCGLSDGAIAGLVIGAIAAVTVIAAIVAILFRRSRRNQMQRRVIEECHQSVPPHVSIVSPYPSMYNQHTVTQGGPAPYPAGYPPPAYDAQPYPAVNSQLYVHPK